jgi:hypothetical protein
LRAQIVVQLRDCDYEDEESEFRLCVSGTF